MPKASTATGNRIAFPIDVSGLDPAGTQETYATLVEQKIFDALYVWDYLARPYKFVPSIATGLLHAAGIAVGLLYGWGTGRVFVRAAGSAVALAGVAFLTGVL